MPCHSTEISQCIDRRMNKIYCPHLSGSDPTSRITFPGGGDAANRYFEEDRRDCSRGGDIGGYFSTGNNGK